MERSGIRRQQIADRDIIGYVGNCDFSRSNTLNFVKLHYEQCTVALWLIDGKLMRCIKKKGHKGSHKMISYATREMAIWDKDKVEVLRW